MSRTLLGIDLGTTRLKVAAFARGRCLVAASYDPACRRRRQGKVRMTGGGTRLPRFVNST